LAIYLWESYVEFSETGLTRNKKNAWIEDEKASKVF